MFRPYPEQVHKLKAASIKIKNELNGLGQNYTKYIQAEYMSSDTEQAFLKAAVGAMDAAASTIQMKQATKLMDEAIRALDLIKRHKWSTDIEKWNWQSDTRHKIVERLFKVRAGSVSGALTQLVPGRHGDCTQAGRRSISSDRQAEHPASARLNSK